MIIALDVSFNIHFVLKGINSPVRLKLFLPILKPYNKHFSLFFVQTQIELEVFKNFVWSMLFIILLLVDLSMTAVWSLMSVSGFERLGWELLKFLLLFMTIWSCNCTIIITAELAWKKSLKEMQENGDTRHSVQLTCDALLKLLKEFFNIYNCLMMELAHENPRRNVNPTPSPPPATPTNQFPRTPTILTV